MSNLGYFLKLIASVRFPQNLFFAFKELRRCLYSDEVFYGLEFELNRKFNIPEPMIPVQIREMRESDIPQVLDLREEGMDSTELRKRLERLLAVRANIPTCHVGVTTGDIPCVMCWLVTAAENNRLQSHFRRGIPELQSGEVLLEGIFTHPEFRGRQLMCYLTLRLFEKAAGLGATRAIAFVHEDNTSSLKGIRRIGWKPFLVKQVRWRWFFRQITYSHDLRA